MVDTLALEKLFVDVQADFLLQGKTTVFDFGVVARTKQDNQGPGGANRIVVHEGRHPDGDIGKLLAPRYPGRVPARPLATLEELFTVLCWAVDTTAPGDPFAQYKAARLLFDDWVAAVYRAAHGTFGFVAGHWSHQRNERRFGAEIESLWTIQAMVPDFQTVPVGPPSRQVTPAITTSLEG